MSSAEVQLRLPAVPQNVALVRRGDVQASPRRSRSIRPCWRTSRRPSPRPATTSFSTLTPVTGTAGWRSTPTRRSGRDDHGSRLRREECSRTPTRVGRRPTAGFGLPLIAALSDKFEIHGGSGLGIEVKMVFLLADDAQIRKASNGSGVCGCAPTRRRRTLRWPQESRSRRDR